MLTLRGASLPDAAYESACSLYVVQACPVQAGPRCRLPLLDPDRLLCTAETCAK